MIENKPHTFVQTATQAIRLNVEEGKRLKKPNQLPDTYNFATGCFVSLHNADGSLRGCIGTIEPRFDNLYDEIVQNAISASAQDPRFSPVEEHELAQLHISVDVLSQPEETTIQELNPDVYGLIITDGYRKGVLLPALETVDTVQKQIDIVKRKAGLSMVPNDDLKFFRFSSKRYE
ncbi:MAG: AmmeMemoRadiSam system protein A [Salinivirgaceae bacterium]|nr:MAG: AmmeMemoRadiSam system protein A [Salinivirgaceae bacterium]